VSQQIDFLVSQAREGKFTPIEFCKALDQLGINHTQRILYVRDVFDLPLDQAKRVLLEADGRSIEAWSEEMGDVINELSTNMNDPDDTSKTG
jgi:peptide subunit release factor RF-3